MRGSRDGRENREREIIERWMSSANRRIRKKKNGFWILDFGFWFLVFGFGFGAENFA